MCNAKYNLLVILFLQYFFTASVDGQCQTVFEKYADTNARGGIEQLPPENYNSLPKCQTKCTVTANCVALDFNRQTLECFLFIDSSGNPPAQGINTAVDHYVLKTECTTGQCENGYSVHEGLSSDGGSYQGIQINSIETCMARCEGYATCKGFEYRRTRKECYLFWTTVALSPSSDAVHYVRGGCERCKVFRRYASTHADGAAEQGQFIDTISECADICASNDLCQAFDFGLISRKCYIHTRAFTRKFGNNVEHFEKLECGSCYNGYSYFENLRASDGEVRNADSLTDCRNLCSDEVLCTGFNYLADAYTCETFKRSDVVLNQQQGTTYYARTNCYECSNTFQEKLRTYSRNGEVLPATVNTADLCKEVCRSRVDCVSVDFNVANKACFLHTAEREEFINDNVNKYYKRFCKVCFEGYSKFEKQASGQGNVQLVIINTHQKCRDKCEEYVSCVAFEFNNVTNTCYTFTANQTLTYNNDVDHYVKTNCQGSTTSRPVTNAPGPPIIGSTTAINLLPTSAPEKCKETFQKIPNAYRAEGFRIGLIGNTEEDCMQACREEKNCAVAEYHKNNFQCYFHSTIGNTEFNANVDRFIKKNCGTCYFGFTVYESARGTGGSSFPSASTLPQCREKCLKLASETDNSVSCTGFDFQRTCYLHTTSEIVLSYSEVDTHYRYTGCQKCQNTFTELLNSNAVGGTPQDLSLNTVEACKIACRNDPLCAAFDFASSRCWFHALVPVSPGFSAGTTQYVKNACGECIEGFTQYTKARIVGPSLQQTLSIDTFPECREACLRLPDCSAFDLLKQVPGAVLSECHITTVPLANVKFSSNQLSTHYQRTDCGQPITTPTLKPGPIGVCIAGFLSFTGSRGVGNMVTQSDYKTPSACRERCRSIPTCTSFNYYIPTRTCSTSTLSTLEYTDDLDYNYEMKTGCVEQTTPPGGTTLVPFQCVPVFAKRENTYALGGIAYPSATSLPSCLSVCINDQACTAFDHTSTGGCFVHRQYPNSQAGASVDQYIKTPCLGCDEGFSVFEGIRSTGGIDENGFNTLDSCRMRCLQFSSCVGYDFNKVTSTCTRYAGPIGTLLYDENTIHYRKSDCTGCLDTFTTTSNTNMFNGIIQEKIKSSLACRAFCLSKPYSECLAYDWDRVRSECFIHTRVDTTSRNIDVDLFRRKQCYEITTLDPSVTGKPLSCPLTLFQLIPGKMSPSGTPQSRDKNTVDKCMLICEELENCVAMDFSTSLKQCWIFTRDVQEIVDSSGVDHYVKRPCRPCEDGYTLYQDERGGGSDKQPGTFDLISCRTTCDNQRACSGFDYSRVDKECYLFFASLERLQSAPLMGFDHNRKTGCQQCLDRFEEILGLQSDVNSPAIDVSSDRQCQEVCRRLPECIASDFRAQDYKCYIHTNMQDLLDEYMIENPRMTHYRRVPCNLHEIMTTVDTSCPRQFNQEIDTYYRSGGRIQKAEASSSREACERFCRFETSCVAYEWDRRKLLCWRHLQSSDLTTANRIRMDNIDHYRKSDKCSSSTEPQAVVGSNTSRPTAILVALLMCSSALVFSYHWT